MNSNLYLTLNPSLKIIGTRVRQRAGRPIPEIWTRNKYNFEPGTWPGFKIQPGNRSGPGNIRKKKFISGFLWVPKPRAQPGTLSETRTFKFSTRKTRPFAEPWLEWYTPLQRENICWWLGD